VQVGIDSFAAAFETSLAISASDRLHNLVGQIEQAASGTSGSAQTSGRPVVRRSGRRFDAGVFKRTDMLKVAIIIGSTPPGRNGVAVARWVYDIAARRGDASFEVVDIADFDLPLLDEPFPPIMNQYSKPHTRAWAAKIGAFDAFVFVAPEYNHSMSGALKNAIDFLYREWNDKAAGFVGYGGAGGTRAVEQLRLVMGEIKVADVRAQVALSMYDDFENFATFKPRAQQESAVTAMLDDLVAWGRALQAVRARVTDEFA